MKVRERKMMKWEDKKMLCFTSLQDGEGSGGGPVLFVCSKLHEPIGLKKGSHVYKFSSTEEKSVYEEW